MSIDLVELQKGFDELFESTTPEMFWQFVDKRRKEKLNADYSGAEHVETNQMKKNAEGLTAYDILRMPECPIKLPVARSMQQAQIDYEHREEQIFKWYEDNKNTPVDTSPLQSQLNADAATIKHLTEKIGLLTNVLAGSFDENERLTLQLNLAEGRNRELVKLAVELKEAVLKKIITVNTGDPVGMRLYNAIHNLNKNL